MANPCSRLSTLVGSLGFPLLVVVLLTSGCGCGAQAPELGNDRLVVRLDPRLGYAFADVIHRPSGVDFIQAPPPERPGRQTRPAEPVDPSPWLIGIRNASGQEFTLSAANARSSSHQTAGDQLTITWTGVGSGPCPANLTVTVTGRLPAGSANSYWRIAVQGDAPGALWRVDFPRVLSLGPKGETELCVPWYLGRVWHDPARQKHQVKIDYPHPGSMQFLGYWVVPDVRQPQSPAVPGRVSESAWSPDRSDAAGLYWATEDGQSLYKRFMVDTKMIPGRTCWWIENVPPLDKWPVAAGAQPVRYSLPYDAVLGTFTGDWHEAALIYREWAKNQPWCARGPASTWPATAPPAGSEELVRWVPPWWRQIGFWAKSYYEPAKVVPEWAAYRTWLQVPMAAHHYRYTVSAFNDNFPEYLPAQPYFTDGVRDAADMDVRELPYTNGCIWDTDTQSWFRENGFAAALKDEEGAFYPWVLGDQIFAHMDPATEQWRAKVRQAALKLAADHGTHGAYLDVFPDSAGHPCFDPTHQHPLHGGSSLSQGSRQLIHDLVAAARQRDPEACFFSEECNEIVLDLMDGFLTLDERRSAAFQAMETAPIFTAVYHPYAINFGSDAHIGQPPDLYAWEMGQTLNWGMQPLNSDFVLPPPKAGDPNSEFLREVVQAYYQAGLRFLQGGDLRRIAVRPPDSRPGACPLELTAQPYSLLYDQLHNRRRAWYGPAVLASAWERDGDVGVVLANITGNQQSVALTVHAGGLGLPGGAQIVRAWPLPAQALGAADGGHPLVLPPGKVTIVVLTANPANTLNTRPLEPTPWQLVSVDHDGPLPSVTGPAGSLWACSDGPVVNVVGAANTAATAAWLTAKGTFEPRQGQQAAQHAGASEGHGLPRGLSDKPFALLRQLPHRVNAGCGEVEVLSADTDHLSCLAPGGTTFQFGQPGLMVASDAATGKVVHALGEAAATNLTLPAGGSFLVGYASLQGAASVTSSPDLAASLQALSGGPADGRAAALARASTALQASMLGLGAEPGALLPGSPVMHLQRQLEALCVAQTAGVLRVTAADDWLAPGLAKPVTVLGWSRSGAFPNATVGLAAIGGWPTGQCPATLSQASSPGGDVTLYPGQVQLSDFTYLERMVPLVASAKIGTGADAYTLSDVLLLEANRPFEIQKPATVPALGPGQTGKATVVLRNWSPLSLTVSVSVTAPQGWQAAVAAGTVQLPPLSDTPVDVSMVAGASKGPQDIWCHANYVQDPAADVRTLIQASSAASLGAPPAEEGEAPSPAPEEGAP